MTKKATKSVNLDVPTEPEFVDELPDQVRKKSRGKYAEFADRLREQPGRWAKYPSNTKATVYQMRSATSGSFPGSEFEFDQRNGVMYLRYVGVAQLSGEDSSPMKSIAEAWDSAELVEEATTTLGKASAT